MRTWQNTYYISMIQQRHIIMSMTTIDGTIQNLIYANNTCFTNFHMITNILIVDYILRQSDVPFDVRDK